MKALPILIANIFALSLGQSTLRPMGQEQTALIMASSMSSYSGSGDNPNFMYTPDYYNRAGNYSASNCTQDYDCFGSYNVCVNGTCRCQEGYIMETQYSYYEGSNYMFCSPPPNYLFARCETICQEPYVCKENPDNLYMSNYYSSNGYNQMSEKVCQCGDKFQYMDGICILNCTEDEIYDQIKMKCVARCKANEVKIEDDCKPIVALGEQCNASEQCSAVYSECYKNKCVCKDGFAANKDGYCSPKTVTCPSGFALRRGSGYRICQFKEQSLSSDENTGADNKMVNIFGNMNSNSMMIAHPNMMQETELKDDCPNNYFCMVSGDTAMAPTVNSTGYCCPKLKADCPVGKVHPNASCNPKMFEEYCPFDSHFCHSVCGSSKQLCCPRSCSLKQKQINGMCYNQAAIGDSCRIKEQCTDPKADCIKGKCKCGRRAAETGGLYKYCILQCEENETQYDDKCLPNLKLGDSCNEEQAFLCPLNSMCVNGTCQCSQNTVKIAPGVCAQEPYCPWNDWSSSTPAVWNDLWSSTPAVWDDKAIWQQQQSDEKRIMAIINNSTFCKLNNQSTWVMKNIVDKCPSGQYCSYYSENMGVCCKKPEPNCYGNAKVISVKQCELYDPSSCGTNGTCYQYYYPADIDDTGSRVCCEKNW